jgi:hypothetical protein
MRVPEEGLVRVSGCRTFGRVVFRRMSWGQDWWGVQSKGERGFWRQSPFSGHKAYGVTSAPTSPYPSPTYDNAIGSSSRYIQTTVSAHQRPITVVWHSLNSVKPPKTPFQSRKRWFACIAALKNQAATHLYILSGRSMPRRPMAERRTRATASMRTRR